MRKLWLVAAVAAPVLVVGMTSASLAQVRAPGAVHAAGGVAGKRTGLAEHVPFCKELGKRYLASSGAYMYCFGAQRSTASHARPAVRQAADGSPLNVDAATVSEDVNPAGVQADGQSETSIAASGPYVVEAWNDATSFFTSCPAPMSKEEGTGFGFSANGGKTFQDLGGLPNAHCNTDNYAGDPSVAAYQAGGHTYFYISSLYLPVTGLGPTNVAMDACTVTGSGPTATLSCGQPIIIGTSTECQRIQIGPHQFGQFCSFLDKDYIAIDPANGRLYGTYSEFLLRSPGSRETMSVCDLGSPGGGPGPAGGTPSAPVCKHGTTRLPAPHHYFVGKPYFTVAGANRNGCENEGSYPAVDPATGNVYVAYEFNIFTDEFAPCNGAGTPTTDVMTKTPFSCLPLAATAACSGPAARIAVPIVSLNATPVAGYNRFASNDFPRLAVSDNYGVVSMVWNDTRFHPLGDILLESFGLNSLAPVQAEPVVLDAPASGGMHMFPAVRTSTAAGLLDVAWYSRKSTSTSVTNVDAVLGLNPLTTVSPSSNIRITTVGSNWDNAASVIVPNFGDYIDDALSTTGTPPYVGSTLYVAWSDGRLGVPQPFEAHLPG